MTDERVAGRLDEHLSAAAPAPAPQDAQAAARRAALHAAAVLDRELVARSRPGLGARLRRALAPGRT